MLRRGRWDMDIDVQALAERYIAQGGNAAAVLGPLARPIGARLNGRFQTQAIFALALTLAKREHAVFAGTDVDVGGRLIGLEAEPCTATLVALVAHVLELCVTQFGESETRQVFEEAWAHLAN
jgi:hypothetical protein